MPSKLELKEMRFVFSKTLKQAMKETMLSMSEVYLMAVTLAVDTVYQNFPPGVTDRAVWM